MFTLQSIIHNANIKEQLHTSYVQNKHWDNRKESTADQNQGKKHNNDNLLSPKASAKPKRSNIVSNNIQLINIEV